MNPTTTTWCHGGATFGTSWRRSPALLSVLVLLAGGAPSAFAEHTDASNRFEEGNEFYLERRFAAANAAFVEALSLVPPGPSDLRPRILFALATVELELGQFCLSGNHFSEFLVRAGIDADEAGRRSKAEKGLAEARTGCSAYTEKNARPSPVDLLPEDVDSPSAHDAIDETTFAIEAGGATQHARKIGERSAVESEEARRAVSVDSSHRAARQASPSIDLRKEGFGPNGRTEDRLRLRQLLGLDDQTVAPAQKVAYQTEFYETYGEWIVVEKRNDSDQGEKAASRSPNDVPHDGSSLRYVAPVALIVAGSAGVLVGASIGVVNKLEGDELQKEIDECTSLSCAPSKIGVLKSDKADAQSAVTVGIVVGVAGAVAGLAGMVWYGSERHRFEKRAATLVPAPRGFAVVGEF